MKPLKKEKENLQWKRKIKENWWSRSCWRLCRNRKQANLEDFDKSEENKVQKCSSKKKTKQVFFSVKTVGKKTSYNMSVDANGAPTLNHVDVDSCPGCIPRRRNPGPQTWWFDFVNRQDDATKRACRSECARWIQLFNIYSVCSSCSLMRDQIVYGMLTTY